MSDIRLFDRPFALSMGPQRTGTSWIDRYLRERGDVCLPNDVKEIFFFDRHFQRGPDFYTSHFKPTEEHKLMMEVSTTAFDSVQAPQNVKDFFGNDVVLLCPLRHPVARSYSLYQHFRRYGMVNGDLRKAVELMPNILTSGHYADHLLRWFDVFGQDKINIVFKEDLEADHEAFLKNVCDVLGLDYIPAPKYLHGKYNSGALSPSYSVASVSQKLCDFMRANRFFWPIEMARKAGLKDVVFGKTKTQDAVLDAAADDMKWLEDRLLPEVEKLEKLIGKPVANWHQNAP